MLKKFLSLSSLSVCLSLAACGESQTPQKEISLPAVDQQEVPIGQLPEGVTPISYNLLIAADPSDTGFTGRVEIEIDLDKPHKKIWLHSRDQQIESAVIRLSNGQDLVATAEHSPGTEGVMSVAVEEVIPEGLAVLEIEYSADYNLRLAGLYKVSQNGRDYLASQMEPYDARRYVPSFDEPRFKTPWTVTVQAPEGLEVISNGALISSELMDNGWLEHSFSTTRTIPSYLLALAVGPYDLLDGGVLASNEVRAESTALQGFAPSGKSAELEEMLAITDAMLSWQEAYFDYPYPYAKLDLIAAPDFAYGAMENAGAIIYREGAILLNPRTKMSDRRRALSTHAHELGHQWFGNLVTPRWWDDIWLNEAFATWISYKTMDAVFPDSDYDLAIQEAAFAVMDADRLLSARQIRNPILRNADIYDGFDGITYSKGGGVLSMFETYLGEEGFREGIRLHMQRYQDGVADVNDFMQSIADGSDDESVIESFRSFIFQPGTPYIDVELTCSGGNSGYLTLSQSRYAPLGSEIDSANSIWSIPFSARLSDRDGSYEIRHMLSDATTEIELERGCADWVIPNTNGSGYWRFGLQEQDWDQLFGAYDELSKGEQLAIADSLTAAFAAGKISATTLFEGLSLSSQGYSGATSDTLDQLPFYFDALEEEAQNQLRDFISQTYEVRYEQLSSTSEEQLSESEKLLKAELYTTLVEYGRFDFEREALAEAGANYVGVNGDPDSSALDPELFDLALASAALKGDENFYTTALNYALTTRSQPERRSTLNVLARHLPEPQLLDLLSRSLGEEFQGQETNSLFLQALNNKEAQTAAWQKFKEEFERVIARTPEIRRSRTTSAIESFCETELIDEAVAFFEANAELMPGYERRLAQSEESARLCAAFRLEKDGELAEALEEF